MENPKQTFGQPNRNSIVQKAQYSVIQIVCLSKQEGLLSTRRVSLPLVTLLLYSFIYFPYT